MLPAPNPAVIAFAIEAHTSMNHLYDGMPYVYHLSMAVGYGYKYIHLVEEDLMEDVISALWLHDTIENVSKSFNDVKEASNLRVAEMVRAVTPDVRGRNREQRMPDDIYNQIRCTPGATYVKLCDRLSNIAHGYHKRVEQEKRLGSRVVGGMLAMYGKEHVHFLNSLLAHDGNSFYLYGDMIIDMEMMLPEDVPKVGLP